jgi:hypothetical protein
MHWPMTLPSRMSRAATSRGAVPFVVVGDCADAPLLHWQARLGAGERLDLALLIDRQDDGVVRRIDIEPDDVAQDDLRPPDMLLRTVPISDNGLQRSAVVGVQFDLGSFVHSPDSHGRVRWGVHKRIKMSDLVH